MGQLMERLGAKADAMKIPLQAHLDVTWKCNERCVHCYLDHGIGGDMTTDEIKSALDQLAAAGALFLIISGGEIMLRKDIFEIVGHARSLMFDVRLKTNAILIGEQEAKRFGEMGVRRMDISIYSCHPEVHDAVTLVRGSFDRSIGAARRLHAQGIEVTLVVSIMKDSADDYRGIKAIAAELGVKTKFDPTMTPRLDGDLTPLDYRVSFETMKDLYRNPELVDDVAGLCAKPGAVTDDVLDRHSCGAGHSAVYITPQGDVTPCIQFPMTCGNLRRNTFEEIWNGPKFRELRDVRVRDLPVCSTCANSPMCSRCPGLAYMESGDYRAPSSIDCEKSFACTGVPSALMQIRSASPGPEHLGSTPFFAPLVQITGIQ